MTHHVRFKAIAVRVKKSSTPFLFYLQETMAFFVCFLAFFPLERIKWFQEGHVVRLQRTGCLSLRRFRVFPGACSFPFSLWGGPHFSEAIGSREGHTRGSQAGSTRKSLGRSLQFCQSDRRTSLSSTAIHEGKFVTKLLSRISLFRQYFREYVHEIFALTVYRTATCLWLV